MQQFAFAVFALPIPFTPPVLPRLAPRRGLSQPRPRAG